RALPARSQQLAETQAELARLRTLTFTDKAEQKKHDKLVNKLPEKIKAAQEELDSLQSKIKEIESSPELLALAKQHSQIESAVLEETAKLPAGDVENLKLWHEFLPA